MTLLIILLSLLLLLVFVLLFIEPKLKSIAIGKAHKLLLKGFEQNTIKQETDIEQIFDTIDFSYSYVGFLSSFIIFVRENDKDGVLTKSVSDYINPIIEKEREKEQFSGVEDNERSLLLAIRETVYNDEKRSFNRHLVNLAKAIEDKQKRMKRLGIINWISIPLAIVGVVLTIVFGLRTPSLSDQDVERVSKQVYTTLNDSLNGGLLFDKEPQGKELREE